MVILIMGIAQAKAFVLDLTPIGLGTGKILAVLACDLAPLAAEGRGETLSVTC